MVHIYSVVLFHTGAENGLELLPRPNAPGAGKPRWNPVHVPILHHPIPRIS